MPEGPARARAPLPVALLSRFREELRRAAQSLRGNTLSPTRAAAAVALGLFIGSMPLFGLHTPIVIALCLWLRLDCALAWIASNISNPLFVAALIAAELRVGALVRSGAVAAPPRAAEGVGLASMGGDLLVGALLVGAAIALLGAALTWAGLTLRRRRCASAGAR